MGWDLAITAVGRSGDFWISMANLGEIGREGGDQLELDLIASASNSLDSKRRIAIPKIHREQIDAAELSGNYVLCRQLGGEPCLALFPPGQFEKKLREVERLRRGNAGVGTKTLRAYLRKLRMSAAPITPDKQRRITLTEAQCALAGITKEVVFVGSGDHLELWAPERLETTDQNEDFSSLAGELFGDF
jgi:MraZ protein